MKGPSSHYGSCPRCGSMRWLELVPAVGLELCTPCTWRQVPAASRPERVRAELQRDGWRLLRARGLGEDSNDSCSPVTDVTDRAEPADLRPSAMPVLELEELGLLAVAYAWALEHVLEGELDVLELIERPKTYGRRRLPLRERTDISVRSTLPGGWRGAAPAAPSVSRGQVFPGRE